MRITVESAGFTQAAEACRAANEIAAMTTETLAGKLGHYAGMAGNDSSSTSFAESYDDAAAQALTTLTEVTHAFIGLGRLIDATGENHRAAEDASAGRSGRGGTESRHETRGWLHVSPADPPSSLGGQEPSLGTIDQWILDHVEGFAWPGADTGLLRDAATTWRSAASSIEHLDHHLDDIEQLLSRQRSPEIPLALAVLDTVRTLINHTATHLTDLGQSCDDYADAVEEAHDRTRALLAEIGQMIIEGAALSVLATAITGGLGGGAAATAAISRITTQAPRFHAILATLRTIATTSATRARTARDGLRDIRTRADKLARIGARNERGSMKHPLAWGGDRKPGWLKGHEGGPSGAHTIRDHVGKTEEQLLDRMRTQGISAASTFDDQAMAERLIDRVLKSHADEIDAWAAGNGTRLRIRMNFGERTGTTVREDGSVSDATAVRVILQADPEMPNGWRILTGFPD